MPNFLLTMSARHNGQNLFKSYTFESTTPFPEDFYIQSYQEFHPDFTDISVVSLTDNDTGEQLIGQTISHQ